jgi:UDP-3-O-[3-hydroxymyristoyl] N-acetylglucosamine deacetylase
VYQRTIAEKISCTGIGLHSGEPVELTLHPARANTGIVFVRCDGPRAVEIPALASFVASTDHATSLERGGARVSTVEHLLAALYGLGVDNARIEVSGPEIPIMDGSAASFVFLIRAAGIFDQRVPRRILRVRRPIGVRDGQKRIRVEPSRGLRISYGIDFRHPSIGRQSISRLELSEETFERDLCRARTFGFLHEVEALWRAGLGRGGSLDNTVVLDPVRVLNADGLRSGDEFVRHKALDLVGDLALLGMRLQGHVIVERGGHALHCRLIEKLVEATGPWPEASEVHAALAPVPQLA